MASRSRVARSKSPKRAASGSRSHSKKAHSKRAHSKKTMRRSKSASKKTMRRSKSASRRTMRKSRVARRVNSYANFRKANWKKVSATMPGATFAQISRVVAEMWKKAGSKTKSAARKMMRSPRKVRKMRLSKKRAMKKSGSPRKARKDKGKKRGTANAYAMFVKKYFGAKRAALGGNAQPKMVMKALGNDWKQGVRSY